jgi:hypothetical protein
MGRPRKAIRFNWVGKSLAMYENGEYAGSLGQDFLIELFRQRREEGLRKVKTGVIAKVTPDKPLDTFP